MELYFSNSDLLWANEHPRSRLGQVCVRGDCGIAGAWSGEGGLTPNVYCSFEWLGGKGGAGGAA